MNHDFRNAVAALTLTASPQEGDLTLQIKNRNTGRLGFVRQGLTLRDFTGTVLMLSEVQLLLEITAAQKTLLPATIKQERLVAPYPFSAIRKTLPLFCHFEIYNLSAGSYELTYEVTALRERKAEEQKTKPEKNAPTISVTTERSANNKTAVELLALDLSQLKKGAYLLEVRVTEKTLPSARKSDC